MSFVCTRQRQSKQPPKATQQNTSGSSRHHLLQVHERTKTPPVLTAVDVETGMCMAEQIEDRTHHMQHLSTCLQPFLMECSRTQATLNNTVIQSDQKDFLKALLKMTATAVGNIALRQAPACTSQAQGSVERFHRTLMEQIRTLKLQIENNYGIHLSTTHPIMPWLVKHAAYLLNRYSVHSDGNTSYYRRWNKEHKTPICEFVETVLYMMPTAKHRPKMEARFFQAIWLGKDTSTNENILGISGQIVKARARQTKPDKYNKQMMDVIGSTPMTTPTPTSFVVLPKKIRSAAGKQQPQQRHRHSKHRNFQFRKQADTWLHPQSPTFQRQHRQRHTTEEHLYRPQQQQNGT